MGGDIKIDRKPHVPVNETPEITALIGLPNENL
jgi:hypothetical protein